MKHVSVLELFLNICNVFCIFRNKIKICKNENNIKFIRTNTACYILKIVVFLSIISISMYFVCALKDFTILEAHVFAFCSLFTILVIVQLYIGSVTNEANIQKYVKKLFQTSYKIEKLRQYKEVAESVTPTLNAFTVSVAILGIYMFLTYSIQYDFLTGVIYNIGYTTPKVIIMANTMIFVNCLIMLYHNFQMLNQNITPQSCLKQIVESVDIYCELARLSTEINRCFGYQNLTIVAYYLMWVAYEAYHLVLVFLKSRTSYTDIKLIQFSSSWVITNMFIVFLMCIVCQNVKTESKSFKHKLWHLATFVDSRVSFFM